MLARAMKPGDHAEFFLRPTPGGISRESQIRLDREGRFWHEGELVERPSLALALHRWLGAHPVDGRPVLNNGYDWCYVEVEDTARFVQSVRAPATPSDAPTLVLRDGGEEPLDPTTVVIDDDGVFYVRLSSAHGEARFGRHAQTELGAYLADDAPPRLLVGGKAYTIGVRKLAANSDLQAET
jgi:uncharacterized protein